MSAWIAGFWAGITTRQQCTYQVTLRRVRLTIVAEESNNTIYSVCVLVFWPYLSDKQSACAVLCYHLWPVCFYRIFYCYLIKGTSFGYKVIEYKMCEFYILLTVHLDVILVNDQLDALFLNVFISCLYMFRAQVLIIRRAKL
jgi:hypothetical protein